MDWISAASVASFTDAWIETLTPLDLLYANWSHLLQMRGLKLLMKLVIRLLPLVASFTDAWIETREGLLKISSFRSHLLQMRGLKPLSGMIIHHS